MAQGLGIIIGLGASAAAALLLSSGTVLQAIASRRERVSGAVELSLLASLLRRPLWIAGTAIGYLAFPFQLLALKDAPLVLVQPVHACGILLVLLAGVRLLKERIDTSDIVGATAIVVGLAIIAWGSPTGADPAVSVAALLGSTTGLVAVALAPSLLGARCGRLPLMVCSGLGFAGANMAVKGFSETIEHGHYALAGVYITLAALGSMIGVLNQMAAFQRHRATEVVPITFAIPTFLPAVLAVGVLREDWASAALSGAPFAVGALLLVLGTAAVARAAPVTRLARGAAIGCA